MTRRGFVSAAAVTSVAGSAVAARNARPALLGGAPVRSAPFPGWPRIGEVDEKAWMEVLRSGKWYRGNGQQNARFEQAYANLAGVRHCIATANGTSALIAALGGLEIGPGDEVILPPYTFVATVNAVLLHHALPVFVDTDIETFQIDPHKIEAGRTPNTRVILPVHIGGSSADLDTILAIGKKHNIPIVEDACQAHLAEWRGRKVGSWGRAGCFSFQASKNLNSGEGGALVTNDDDLAERCFTFHNNGRGRKSGSFSYTQNGANLRLTEFQAALLLAQMTRLEEQSRLREQNAAYLTSMLKEVPGITPARLHEGCTRNAYHLYMFRYNAEAFAGLPRQTFLKALKAEGIPASAGYSPLNQEPFVESMMASRGYQAVYGRERLARWRDANQCPMNDRLCQEAVWFTQTMLLDTRRGMEQIAEAVRKIQLHAPLLRSS